MISVIMPVYNAVPYIKDAITDIINQTYDNFELICVDDGSTDKSVEIIKYYAQYDSRIILIQQNKSGAGEARNKGIHNANGEYLIFLDADDRFQPTLLETFSRSMFESEADIVICDAVSFDSNSLQIVASENFGIIKSKKPQKKYFSYKDCSDEIFGFTSSWPWNKCFRTEFVWKSAVLFDNTPYWNDIFFVCVCMILAKKITIVDDALIFYRCNRDKSVSAGDNIRINPYNGFYVFSRLREKLIQMDKYEYIWKSLAKFAARPVFANLELIDANQYLDYISKLREFVYLFRMDELGYSDLDNHGLIDDINTIKEMDDIQFLCYYAKKNVHNLYPLLPAYFL